MLRSDLGDYSDVYTAVKELVTIKGNNKNNREDKKLTFRINAPFGPCISKIKKHNNRQCRRSWYCYANV